MKRHRRYSSFPVLEEDCLAWVDDIEIRVYWNTHGTAKVEYCCYGGHTPDTWTQIKQAVNIWVNGMKFGGLSLQDYLNGLFGGKLP